jgi:ceramide glucosyltransferase
MISFSALLLPELSPPTGGAALSWLLWLPLLGCLSAIGYYGYAIYAAQRFFGQPTAIDPTFQPAVSILKPVCGREPQAYQQLASFCRQVYPTYQIIFAVPDEADAGLPVIRQIMQEFADVDLHLVISDRPLGSNRKVSNVANAFAQAKHDIILLADSDVHVEPHYLQAVVQPLRDPQVGVVTCLYRSAATGWVTQLEALSSTTEFHPGVLVSHQLEGVQFAMGQTIVLRRTVLAAIGGLAAIADYLADDFQLGYLPAQAGYRVVLSSHIIEHVMAPITVMGSWQRQVRWMVGIRVSRPWGYVGLIFTYGTVASLVFCWGTGGSGLGWLVLGLTWSCRFAMAWLIGVQYLRDPIAQKLLWLVPLRDLISFGLWGYGFWGNTIKWRDRQFKLTRAGKLVPDPQPLDAVESLSH